MQADTTAVSTFQKSFDVFYLGVVEEVNLGGLYNRDVDVHLIDKVEEAQLEGKLHITAKDDLQVNVTITQHGVRIVNKLDKLDTIQRLPLHSIVQIVYYSDCFSKSNVVLKICLQGRHLVYDCYVFQCHSEEEAQSFCQALKDLFDIVASS